MFLVKLVRDGDLDGFFSDENQSFPPALNQFGGLRSGTKSDLLSCFEKIGRVQTEAPQPTSGGLANGRRCNCKYADTWCITDNRKVQSKCVSSVRESSTCECHKSGCCLGLIHRG